jgi:hypothetical protein
MTLNSVTFPSKGKGRKGQTYICQVFGTAKLSKKSKKFIGLRYSTENIREEQVRQILTAKNIDHTEAMMRGADVILRLKASGGSSLVDTLIARLSADGICKDLQEKDKQVRFRAYADTILKMTREFKKKTLDDCYKMFIENI